LTSIIGGSAKSDPVTMVMNCMGWRRQEVVTIDTTSGSPTKKQKKSEEAVQQDSDGNTLGTVIMVTTLGTVIMITKSFNCYYKHVTSFCSLQGVWLDDSRFFECICFSLLFVAFVTVPSYGYAQMKPTKCDNPCSIETNSDGLYVLQNECITAEIDRLGRITVLTLQGEKRYRRLYCFD
jgi:hypothetical protein